MSLMGLVVRQAEERDLDDLLALLGELDDDDSIPTPAYRAAAGLVLTETIRDPQRHLLVVERDGRAVGTAEVIVLSSLRYGAKPWAVVENVVVATKERRGGVGRALMASAVDLARESGCYKVQLQSGNRRVDAHRFYEGIGFQPASKGFKIYF